ncbi:MAG: dienelactone hydrolase family protein, partial [Candidatus Cloacimonetes bacterium]|nr:dienelactone hydrolase family protein [Candidatus Cloacimonadota bacterium]
MGKNIIKFIILILAVSTGLKAVNLTDYISEITADPNSASESLYQLFQNFQGYDDPVIKGDLQIGYNSINDTLKAPFIYVLPSSYDPLKSTPLLINLHGGVGRQEFIQDPLEAFKQNIYLSICEKESWILLIPLGNADCMWWDQTGMLNIKTLILKMKNEFNIDDDRVYLTGFSDGGSGSFHFALNDPGNFAALYPLNGMLTVGSAVTGIPVYPANLANRPVYAINTDKDGLYPAAEMRKLMQLGLNAGADLFYREYWGYGHSFDYADQELPLMINHMKRTSRNPFPEKIYWECHDPAFGCCDWLKITKLDT